MKLTLIALALATLPSLASATELTYRIDLAHSKMDETTAFDICNLPREIKMDARADLPTVVIKRTQALDPKLIAISFIQATEAGMGGGDLVEPYMGDYRTRVALVRVKDPTGAYKSGFYSRVEVTTFGSKAAPKAFTVDMDILNYRDSAELAENSICTGYAYRLE